MGEYLFQVVQLDSASSSLLEPLLGRWACLRVSQPPLVLLVWGGRGLLNLVNFRDFLQPWSGLLPELKVLPCRVECSIPLLTSHILKSFPWRWTVLPWRILVYSKIRPIYLLNLCLSSGNLLMFLLSGRVGTRDGSWQGSTEWVSAALPVVTHLCHYG